MANKKQGDLILIMCLHLMVFNKQKDTRSAHSFLPFFFLKKMQES